MPTVEELFDAYPPTGVTMGPFDLGWDDTDESQVAIRSTPESVERARRAAEEGRRTLAYHRAKAAWLKLVDGRARAGGDTGRVLGDVVRLRPEDEER